MDLRRGGIWPAAGGLVRAEGPGSDDRWVDPRHVALAKNSGRDFATGENRGNGPSISPILEALEAYPVALGERPAIFRGFETGTHSSGIRRRNRAKTLAGSGSAR